MKFEKRRKGKKIFREKIGVNPVGRRGEERRKKGNACNIAAKVRRMCCKSVALKLARPISSLDVRCIEQFRYTCKRHKDAG